MDLDLDLYVYKDYRTELVTGQRVWRGTWYWVISLPAGTDGKRPTRKRRGFATKTAAQADGDKTLIELRTRLAPTARLAAEPVASEPVAAGTTPASASEGQTVGEYLTGWLAVVRMELEVTGWKNYRTILHTYVIPWIGHRKLALVTEEDLTALYAVWLHQGGHRRCVTRSGRCDPADCEHGRLLSRSVRLVHRVLRKAFKDATRSCRPTPQITLGCPRRAAARWSHGAKNSSSGS